MSISPPQVFFERSARISLENAACSGFSWGPSETCTKVSLDVVGEVER